LSEPPASQARAGGPRLALLLLCHEAPAVIARRLSAPFFRHPDVATYIHYDGARSAAQRAELKQALPAGGRFRFVDEALHCRWGDHTLVEATRRLMVQALADPDFVAEHLLLLSASCLPYRPVSSLQAYLRQRPGIEFIQAQDIGRGRWVKDGLERERFEFYFPFNYREQRRWFEWATERQREFRVKRSVPDGLAVHFGSQWFCLTRPTAAAVAQELARPAIRQWLRWSWIPDEFALQTLVAKHCPPARIAGHNLTYYEFDEQGHPLVLENDHHEHLLAQPFFFARKIAPEAQALVQAIDEHTAAPESDLGYFAQVGMPTAGYVRHLAQVNAGAAARAHVGTAANGSRSVLASNTRRYYVLRASSRAWLLALLRRARGDTRLPIFDLPFGRFEVLVAEAGAHRGFAPSDRFRRDHDPAAYLLELVQTDPVQPAAFGLDVRIAGWARDAVRADPRATLIDADPPLSREQRAATMLAEAGRADEAAVIQPLLEAMRDGAPLPDERFASAADGPRACQTVALRELGPDLGDATLLALRNAYHALDPAPHHVAPGVAWRQFWK
jgi:hypothetical protein